MGRFLRYTYETFVLLAQGGFKGPFLIIMEQPYCSYFEGAARQGRFTIFLVDIHATR